MQMIKPIEFLADSLDVLRTFLQAVRREIGFQLDRIQHGLDPDDSKAMHSIGANVHEIRIRDVSGIYRVIYVAKFKEAVFVLHCFQKKSEKTAKPDIDLARSRLKELIRRLK